tara:strand:- start:499 stop:687 length:189 start_codon:yes stop_codon:yes gene_type:complete
MSITVTNASKDVQRSAGIDFKPGKNTLSANVLTAAKRCQIEANSHLTISESPTPAKSKGEAK